MSTRYYDKALQENLNLGTGTATRRSPAGGSLAGTQIGIHSFAQGRAAVSQTWTPGTIAAGASVSTTVPYPDVALGDFAPDVSLDISLQGCQMTASVSAPNVVTVVISNLTGASVVLGVATLRALAFKSR